MLRRNAVCQLVRVRTHACVSARVCVRARIVPYRCLPTHGRVCHLEVALRRVGRPRDYGSAGASRARQPQVARSARARSPAAAAVTAGDRCRRHGRARASERSERRGERCARPRQRQRPRQRPCPRHQGAPRRPPPPLWPRRCAGARARRRLWHGWKHPPPLPPEPPQLCAHSRERPFFFALFFRAQHHFATGGCSRSGARAVARPGRARRRAQWALLLARGEGRPSRSPGRGPRAPPARLRRPRGRRAAAAPLHARLSPRDVVHAAPLGGARGRQRVPICAKPDRLHAAHCALRGVRLRGSLADVVPRALRVQVRPGQRDTEIDCVRTGH